MLAPGASRQWFDVCGLGTFRAGHVPKSRPHSSFDKQYGLGFKVLRFTVQSVAQALIGLVKKCPSQESRKAHKFSDLVVSMYSDHRTQYAAVQSLSRKL